MKKSLLLLLFSIVMIAGLHAQDRLKRKGDELYDRLSYKLAIPYYLSYLQKHEDNDATLKLADCYRLTHNYPHAATWYDKASLIPNAPPIVFFYFGHALLQNGDLENAKEMFQRYASDPRGKNYLHAIDRYDELMEDSIRVELVHLPFNSKNSEFGVCPYQGGIIFASAREAGLPVNQNFDWLDAPFLNFFFTELKKDSAAWSKPTLLKGDVNSRYHESNFTLGGGDSSFIFTRNNFIGKEKGKSDEGIIKLKLYKGVIEGLDTRDISELGFNSDQYSTTHPSLSADGQTLYFVSDMPGGEGGKDLYYCTRQGEGWSAPVNLKTLNTPGDEVFPYIHPDGTLYFSSDGHPGLGLLDIYYAQLNGNQQVVNMGYPINTAWDDFAFYLDANNENGYLSSDRPGGDGGDDIYQLRLRRPMLQIWVLDSIAQLPLEGATVRIKDLTDNSQYTFETDSTGQVEFKTYFAHSFEIDVETHEFAPRRSTFSTDPGKGDLVFRKEITLWSPPPAMTGIVVDDSSKKRLAGSEVEFINLRAKTSETRVADKNGRFHIRLEPFTYYEINVRREGYLTYSQRVSTTQKTFEGDTIIPLKMERIVFNKPIRLENIHYDFDKWTIRADAYNDLIFLANLMKKNPTLIVELGSHTDCRGSDKYNEILAQKRANSARYFLIDLGVATERISGKGYGEYELSNECDDGIVCSEDKHFQNRRTEFKIVGTIEGVDMKNSVLETKEGGTPTKKYVPEAGNVKPNPAIDSIKTKTEIPLQKSDSAQTKDSAEETSTLVAELKKQPIEKDSLLTPPLMVSHSGDPVKPPVVSTKESIPVTKANPAPTKLDTAKAQQPIPAKQPDPKKPSDYTGDSAPEEIPAASVLSAKGYPIPNVKYDPTKTPGPDQVRFRIRLGGFKSELSPESLARLSDFKNYIFFNKTTDELYVYYIGEYTRLADAQVAMRCAVDAGYYGAYLTGFKGGKEMTYGEMRGMK
jgi:outer membrane protein OmpA-like peptidoglycan-associated protein